MKNRLFKMAAAIMAVVCLTGCTNGIPNLSLANAAKKYGMQELEDDYFLALSASRPEMDDFEGAYYSVVEDSQEANFILSLLNINMEGLNLHFDRDDGIEMDRVEVAAETRDTSNDRDACHMYSQYILMTAADEKSAKIIYDAEAAWIKEYLEAFEQYESGFNSGNKNGITYTTGCITSSSYENHDRGSYKIFYGIYISGKNVVWINGCTNEYYKTECTDFICKEMGLVSPNTLK